MSFKKEIEQGLEQVLQMQEQYRQVRDMEVLPLSFFSVSYDILRNLTTSLHEMEAAQLATMQEQFSRHETMIVETNILFRSPLKENPTEQNLEEKELVKAEPEKIESVQKVQEKTISVPLKKEEPEIVKNSGFLGDTISKHLFADLKKALSLNDRFRFQRDLFGGDSKSMNDTLDQLNQFTSYNDAMKFLNDNFEWNWEQEPAAGLKELLEKRFL